MLYTQIFFLKFIVLQNDVDLFLKSCSIQCFKHIKIKKMEALGKNPQNYEGARYLFSSKNQ